MHQKLGLCVITNWRAREKNLFVPSPNWDHNIKSGAEIYEDVLKAAATETNSVWISSWKLVEMMPLEKCC